MDSLMAADSASQLEMTVARNTMNTLIRYIENLGNQMKAGSTVDEDVKTLEEIRNVGSLDRGHAGRRHHRRDRCFDDRQQPAAAGGAGDAVLSSFVFSSRRWCSHSSRSARCGRAIARPIVQLKHFAGMIAAGHLDVRAPPPGVSELSDLTSSFNTMAGKLADLIEENKREQENLKKERDARAAGADRAPLSV